MCQLWHWPADKSIPISRWIVYDVFMFQILKESFIVDNSMLILLALSLQRWIRREQNLSRSSKTKTALNGLRLRCYWRLETNNIPELMPSKQKQEDWEREWQRTLNNKLNIVVCVVKSALLSSFFFCDPKPITNHYIGQRWLAANH